MKPIQTQTVAMAAEYLLLSVKVEKAMGEFMAASIAETDRDEPAKRMLSAIVERDSLVKEIGQHVRESQRKESAP